MKLMLFIVLIIVLLISCNDNHKADQLLKENTIEAVVINEPEAPASSNAPLLDCYEFLSPIELIELWQMMKAETFHNKAICFGGYIYSKDINESSSKGMISFRPFKNEKIIPMVECEFTGEYREVFDNYTIGEKVKIVGKLRAVEDRDKHNFIFTNCSIK